MQTVRLFALGLNPRTPSVPRPLEGVRGKFLGFRHLRAACRGPPLLTSLAIARLFFAFYREGPPNQDEFLPQSKCRPRSRSWSSGWNMRVGELVRLGDALGRSGRSDLAGLFSSSDFGCVPTSEQFVVAPWMNVTCRSWLSKRRKQLCSTSPEARFFSM